MSADKVKLLLSTGGKDGVDRENLFSFTGWATERLTPWSGRDIPKSEIVIPAIGRSLGPDGLAYGVLSDGEESDINPVLSRSYYAFDITPGKHKLRIKANEPTLEPDKAVTGAQFCVGQKVTLTPSWDYTPPSIHQGSADLIRLDFF